MILKTTLPSVVAAAACWKPLVLRVWGTGNLLLLPENNVFEENLKVLHFYIKPVVAGGHYKKDLEHKTVKHKTVKHVFTVLGSSYFYQEKCILFDSHFFLN